MLPSDKFPLVEFVDYRLVSGYKKIKFINKQNTWSVSLISDFLPFYKSLIQQVESLFPADPVSIKCLVYDLKEYQNYKKITKNMYVILTRKKL